MLSRAALITGIGGQDGSLLAESLLQDGIRVVGIERPGRIAGASNLSAIQDHIHMVAVDLSDSAEVSDLVRDVQPTWVFHLAGTSFVPASWDAAGATIAFAATSTGSLLDAICDAAPEARFFNASSAEVFGRAAEAPQTEATRIQPTSPYGAAKAASLQLVQMYRERFGLHASSGILYNHESRRRPLDFVSHKITHAAAAISLGMQSELRLGSLDARRDWSHADDFVRGMRLIADAPTPGEFILASGESRSVQDFVAAAFSCVGLDWQKYVVCDEQFTRQNDTTEVVGNPSKAERELGWRCERPFVDWVREMVESDIALLSAR